ncbi:putative nucleoporin, Nup155 [Rosa chinensis]|uniref:Putative nucleoporin, Nup155 n=1 Tax=Rosa chinensis TaxID=74649 RepID=A0A2P6S475_ROSCH|nr:putative nucleoporin, Nup155 [Rosa chinensis]
MYGNFATHIGTLSGYTVSSDGVSMTCVTCSDNGRIFMAGRDGHIYELKYTKWQRRCWKVCVSNAVLQDFFNHYGAGEAAAMCLMPAAGIVHPEVHISKVVAQNAAEAFEDQRLVQKAEIVEEAEPDFSAAHEGLCLCSARLLLPLWELPFVVEEGGSVMCILSLEAMQVLQKKISSLENFLWLRRKQRRGLYGRVSGLGYLTGYRDESKYDGSWSNNRKRLFSDAELTAMEVRAMECMRQLLIRLSEAQVLLQLLSQQGLITCLAKDLDANLQQVLVQLTFHQLVCSKEGNHLATRLISGLTKYYTDQGKGTVHKISAVLQEGCPSYYKESGGKYYLAMDCLQRAVLNKDAEEMEKLARETYSCKVPKSANLQVVCKWFEGLRFYEAVVHLPLQKAQALDPKGDAFNNQIDAAVREDTVAKRVQCHDIIISALRSLKGVHIGSSSRNRHVCQIVQLGIRFPDRLFHEYLCRAMIDFGLENELFEFGGPNLVPLLQSVAGEPIQEVQAISPIGHSGTLFPTKKAKYCDVLASYYALKDRLAAHALQRLA